MFVSENEMSLKFEKYVRENFGNAYMKEVSGLFGRPDFLFYSKKNEENLIISFELKLHNWKRALIQAFRYKSFSNTAYVVLPEMTMEKAESNIELFKNYNIGLATFTEDNNFLIKYIPTSTTPYSDNLTQKLNTVIKKKRGKAKNMDILILEENP